MQSTINDNDALMRATTNSHYMRLSSVGANQRSSNIHSSNKKDVMDHWFNETPFVQ